MAFSVTEIGKREWKQPSAVGDFKYRYYITSADAGSTITLCNPGSTSADVTGSTQFGLAGSAWSIVEIKHAQPEAYTLTIKSGTTTVAVYDIAVEQSLSETLGHHKVIEEALQAGDDLIIEITGGGITNMEIQVVDQWLL